MTVTGKPQNCLYLNANELTTVEFPKGVRRLEFFNVGGGTVWIKWFDDCVAQVGGATSTPIAPGVAYDRASFPIPGNVKIGMIAEANATLVVNIV